MTPRFERQFFPHDFGARNDEKVVELLATHGMEGYGILWSLYEKLYENNGFLDANYKLLSYDLRVDESMVKKIIEDSKLFSLKGGKFYSESVLRRLEIRRAKSSKASMAAHVKWEKEKSATAQDDFKAFWKAYPKQEGPDAAMAVWQEKKPDIAKCLKALSWQKNLPKWNEDNGRWIPAPAAYLKSGKWADIMPGHSEEECPACNAKGSIRKGFKGKVNCGKCGHKFEVS